MNGTCTDCGRSDIQVVMHHVDYEHDITIPLCRSCHKKLHINMSINGVSLYPPNVGLPVHYTIRDRLKTFGNMGDHYDDVMIALMDACEPATEFRQKSEDL